MVEKLRDWLKLLRANEKFIFPFFSWVGGIVALRGIENLEGGMFEFADWGINEDLTFIKICSIIKWGIFIYAAMGGISSNSGGICHS